jgi:hypothetical protein
MSPVNATLNLNAWPAFAELPLVAIATRERIARRDSASALLRFEVNLCLFTRRS